MDSKDAEVQASKLKGLDWAVVKSAQTLVVTFCVVASICLALVPAYIYFETANYRYSKIAEAEIEAYLVKKSVLESGDTDR